MAKLEEEEEKRLRWEEGKTRGEAERMWEQNTGRVGRKECRLQVGRE